MTARYELRERGVYDHTLGRVVLPGSASWHEYLDHVRSGGSVNPMPAAVAPAPTQAELDDAAERDARKAIRDELRADAAIRALCTRTPTQVNNWIDANVTDLASARNVLKIIARVLAILAREQLPPPDAAAPVVPSAKPNY